MADNEAGHNEGGLSGPTGNMGSGPGGAHGYGNPGGESNGPGGGASGDRATALAAAQRTLALLAKGQLTPNQRAAIAGSEGVAAPRSSIGRSGAAGPGSDITSPVARPLPRDPVTGLPYAAPNPSDPNSPSFGRQNITAINPQTGRPFGPSDTFTSGPLAGTTTNSNTLDSALGDYADRSFLHRALMSFVPGLEDAKPNPDQPSSYVGGTYHTGLNPGSAIGTVASALTGFPGLSSLLGEGYNLIGGRDVILGGPGSTAIPQNGTTYVGGPYSSPGVQGSKMTAPSAPAAPAAPRTAGNGFQIPTSTPAGSVPSTATQPVQASPATTTTQQQSGGQTAPGGRTIITGANSVAWPWNQAA